MIAKESKLGRFLDVVERRVPDPYCGTLNRAQLARLCKGDVPKLRKIIEELVEILEIHEERRTVELAVGVMVSDEDLKVWGSTEEREEDYEIKPSAED